MKTACAFPLLEVVPKERGVGDGDSDDGERGEEDAAGARGEGTAKRQRV